VSLFAAMLGSLDEGQAVLADEALSWIPKRCGRLPTRYAARARLEQQVNNAAFEDSGQGAG